METANKLELHYYFNDNSHTMDALIRNKCEAELLALINEVKNSLGFDFSLDAEALREGGLINKWKALGENQAQIQIILTIILIIIGLATLYQSKDDEIDIELKKLDREEKLLNIEKLKRELAEGNTNDKTVKESAISINNDFKILTRKSNLYKQLDSYEKITKLGINALTIDDKPIQPEKIIPKADFYKYILSTNDLPVEVVEDAEIEIISPVLREGKYKWKGIYQDEPISFHMADTEFKNDVLSKKVSFQHGTIILCVLKICRELDETGEIVVKAVNGYTVNTVISKIDDEKISETSQGRRYKLSKKFIEGQEELFKPQE